MNKSIINNLKKDIYTDERIKIDFQMGKDANMDLLIAGDILEMTRISA